MKEKELTKDSFPSGFCAPHLLSAMGKETPILVAFSGGADSHVLLHLLCRYSNNAGAKIYAAHVNHCIRGDEADRDEQFCKDTAKKYGVTFFSERIDVPRIARESSKSIELAARDERYAFFARLMKEHGIPLLAVAHNANDNLETVLYNLTRGSALLGLCGIPPTRECDGGTLIRPILSMSREDILGYCEENGLEYVTDSTNTDVEYARNRIRSSVIPQIKVLNPSVERAVLKQSELLRDDARFLNDLAAELLRTHLKKDGSLPFDVISSAKKPISSRAIIKLCESAGLSSLDHRHIESVLSLCDKGVPHSRISLPNGIYASIENNSLFVGNTYLAPTQVEPYCIEVGEGESFISQTNCEIVIGSSQKQINIYKKSIQLQIDFDKISGALTLRSRKEGDRIFCGGMHKSVKKLMCDKKIPTDVRARLPMICDGDEIVAIPFVAVNDKYRIGRRNTSCEDTRSIYFYLY